MATLYEAHARVTGEVDERGLAVRHTEVEVTGPGSLDRIADHFDFPVPAGFRRVSSSVRRDEFDWRWTFSAIDEEVPCPTTP
jgi:hypothetical protein